MEAAQVSADRQQTPFVIMKSLAIFEMTTHNQSEAVEIVQPRKENFMLVFQDNEENALVYLTIKQGDDGYTVGLDISPSLMEMSPDKPLS